MKKYPDRRAFLKTAAVSTMSLALHPSLFALVKIKKKKVVFGLITDLHQDIVPDGKDRLQAFLAAAKSKKVDALIQMGDFAVPSKQNQEVISLFNSAHSHSFHVLGNHDVDNGFSWEECKQAYGMEASYYSQEIQGIKIIVLDGNEPDSPTFKSGYPSYIGESQQVWLRNELEEAVSPCVIISHQPIAGIYTIDNAGEIQEILSQYAAKILLAINGHAHVDQHVVIGGVNYVHINSASYYWVGERLAHYSYSPSIHDSFPNLKFTCPYSDSLFAFLTIDWNKGEIQIEGRRATWIGPSPQELGYTILTEREQKENLTPAISSRKIK
jgi:3',5'-cyclic-AMP phosphodiesterase